MLMKNAILRDLAYRFNFLSAVVASVSWVNFTLILILVLGNKTGGFGGWNEMQMLLLTGFWMINNGMAYFLFYSSLKSVDADVNRGTLDYVLYRPLDSQFFLAFRRIILNSFVGVIEGIIIVVYAASQLNLEVTALMVLEVIIILIASIIIYYSLWFMSATLSIHFIMIENIFQTVPDIVELSKFPPRAYPATVSQIFTSFIPILIMTAFPARLVMGELKTIEYFYALGLAVVFLFLSRIFWKWSLKKYEGGSV
jgi:ABC-2 type transport system permease protein